MITQTSLTKAAARAVRIDHVSLLWEIDPDHELPEDVSGIEAYSCTAIATVSYPINDKGDRRLETFHSGGLYGITLATNPSRDPYCRDVEAGQLEDLRDHLAVFGIVDPAFDWKAVRMQGQA